MNRTRLLALVTGLVLLVGCEDQEAVALSRSVPMAILQGAVLAVVVGGGFFLFHRLSRRPQAPAVVGYGAGEQAAAPRPATGPLDLVGAVLFGLVALGAVGFMALWIVATPGSYDEPSNQLFSWEETVTIGWVLLVPSSLLALFELRLASALLARRPWARWGAGVQLGLVGLSIAWGAVANATG